MYVYTKNRKIYLNVWDKVINPKGVIQIVHGMAEYGERYKKFAEFFNSQGFIVVADDHYGHNRSIENFYGELAHNSFQTYVEDEICISDYLKNKYEIPIHLLGHSMGSFITQYLMLKDLNYIRSYSLLGSCYTHNLKTKLGSLLIGFISVIRSRQQDKLIDKLMFGNYNNRFEKRTAFDWLSKNQRNVDTYIEDSACGVIYPTGFYKSFVSALYNLHIDKEFKRLRNKKNILILSGAADPVGEFSKGAVKLKDFYKKNGFQVDFKLYEMLRHELLNEDGHLIVYRDILNFIEAN